MSNMGEPRPADIDALAIEAQYRRAGMDRDGAHLFAQLGIQTQQSHWDQANPESLDAYSALQGRYAVHRSYDDRVPYGRVQLQRGEIVHYPVEIMSDYSGDQFRADGSAPLEVDIRFVGRVTLHYSAFAQKEVDAMGVQFPGDARTYPALRYDIVYGGDDYGDGGSCHMQTEIVELGYTHPNLFVPKPLPQLPPLVAGRDYLRPGHVELDDGYGYMQIMEPDGEVWTQQSNGLVYDGPEDMVGMYL
jgi:hypothetical protein